MIATPDLETFLTLAREYDAIPVSRRLLADSLTPVSAFRRLDTGGTACLFESVVGGEKIGRYSFLALEPFCSMVAYDRQVTWGNKIEKTMTKVDNPWDELRRELRATKVAPIDGLPPFVGGAVGYAGYDSIRYVEKLPNVPTDDRGLPDLSFAFYDRMIVFDHVTKTIEVIALARLAQFDTPRDAYADAVSRLESTVKRLNTPHPTDELSAVDISRQMPSLPEIKHQTSQTEFESSVNRCVEYIRAGDIFQVVLSQRMETPLQGEPLEIYRTLRVLNPSPFMFFVRTHECTLVGSSPEIMCRVVDRKMTVRPLAGTRKRGTSREDDLELERQLLADEKERAEHVMLVDLGRNDVGRVAKYGTVAMPDLMVVERYSHVMHISSTVTGELREDADAFDALMASLPAGTVSGAPKVRAMEIIDELEPVKRGPYAGAVGYIDYSNNMDTCIALRTLVITNNTIYVQAGAGIVADSDPTSEYQETMNKAMGLLKAIEVTNQRVSESSR
ncbi:MAG: anthranilate synthase component I [Pirellulaceae bacterium]